MSRRKIKTKEQNTLFCIMFTLRRSQNYSQWSTPSQNKQAFECLSYPWLAFFFWIQLDFLQLSDTDAELRTFSWPWLKLRNTPSALNCVISCLYWAFHCCRGGSNTHIHECTCRNLKRCRSPCPSIHNYHNSTYSTQGQKLWTNEIKVITM